MGAGKNFLSTEKCRSQPSLGADLQGKKVFAPQGAPQVLHALRPSIHCLSTGSSTGGFGLGLNTPQTVGYQGEDGLENARARYPREAGIHELG